jgi:hypothetical protein
MISSATLENYYEILHTKFKLSNEYRKTYGKVLSPDFNSFNFWWLDENKVSDILAFFLDPEQTHSQGKIFLNKFIEIISLKVNFNSSPIRVTREYVTDENRRIDIVIDFNNGEFLIGIENKIYETTEDQLNQIKHYTDFLNIISKGRYCLLYLSPKNKNIAEHSIPAIQKEELIQAGKLKIISFEDHIIECVHCFAINSESDRVRSFLLDFERELKQRYIGGKFMDDNELIIDFAKSNLQNLETTLKIGNTIGSIKSLLKNKFYEELQEIAVEFNCTINNEFYNSPSLFPNGWVNHCICFYYNGDSLTFGIRRIEWNKDRTRRNEIEDILGGSWNVTNWFLVESYLHRNFESNPVAWLEIENGELKNKAQKFIKLAIELLSSSNL